jgi:hypothetical protein
VLKRDTCRGLRRGLFDFAERNTLIHEFLGEPCVYGFRGGKRMRHRAKQEIDGP